MMVDGAISSRGLLEGLELMLLELNDLVIEVKSDDDPVCAIFDAAEILEGVVKELRGRVKEEEVCDE